jgi:CDP-glycerol glycerophosphotransferase (TagB/SpsB family)
MTCRDEDDTTIWNNNGYNCKYYLQQHWCVNDAANVSHAVKFGESFNYPEKNCCDCGKPRNTQKRRNNCPTSCKKKKLLYLRGTEGQLFEIVF